jgi:hypothetical protein
MCACSRRHSQPRTVPCFTQWRSRLTEYLSCRRSCTCASMRYCPSMSVTMAVCLRSGAPHAGITVPAHAPKKKRQLSCCVQHDSRLAHNTVHTCTHTMWGESAELEWRRRSQHWCPQHSPSCCPFLISLSLLCVTSIQPFLAANTITPVCKRWIPCVFVRQNNKDGCCILHTSTAQVLRRM